MREFASPAARAATLARPVKVLYTAFCGFTFAGMLSCVGLYDGIVGFSARATPAELYGRLVARYQTQVAPQKLLETTHFHLFSMPIYLLVLGHLFLLSGLSARAKTGWISAAVALTAVHLCAPWAVHFGGAALAWIYPISGAGMLVTLGVLMGVPVHEMWIARRPKQSAVSPGAALRGGAQGRP